MNMDLMAIYCSISLAIYYHPIDTCESQFEVKLMYCMWIVFFLQFNENTLTNIQTHRYWGPSGRCINCFWVKLLSEQSTTTLLLLTILSSIQLENEAIFTDSRLIFSVFLLHETDRPLILGLKCTAKKYIIDFKRKNGHVSESIRVQSYRYPNPYPYSSEIQMDWFRKQSNYFKN